MLHIGAHCHLMTMAPPVNISKYSLFWFSSGQLTHCQSQLSSSSAILPLSALNSPGATFTIHGRFLRSKNTPAPQQPQNDRLTSGELANVFRAGSSGVLPRSKLRSMAVPSFVSMLLGNTYVHTAIGVPNHSLSERQTQILATYFEQSSRVHRSMCLGSAFERMFCGELIRSCTAPH